MRALFLTKQLYMGKDLLRDRFGRFYEIPEILAARGNQICGVCLKYWTLTDRFSILRQSVEGVEWQSFQLGWNWPVAIVRHIRRLKKIARKFEPDIIVGASDAAHIIMADYVATGLGLPLAVDLYDNFESYGATRLPGMKRGLRRVISNAAAISTVSDNLSQKVKTEYRAAGLVCTITNAVRPEIFHDRDKVAARRTLDLPESALLVGTAGALGSGRGTNILLSAFDRLSCRNSSLFLVLAGPLDGGFLIPKTDKVRYLGELSHCNVGNLFNALDVGVVCNLNNQFAEYCFPQKFYEMLACRLPVVAADVGAMRALLAPYDCLYDPESPDSLARAVEGQLAARRIPELVVPSWKDRGADFQRLLEQALSTAHLTQPRRLSHNTSNQKNTHQSAFVKDSSH